MSENRRDHMIKYLEKNVRFDGRKKDEIRKISIEYGVSKNAEGSAKVTFGETIVIAGVKMMVEKPYSDKPDEGSLMVGAELLAMSNPDFEAGPPTLQAIELARVVDRGIREAKAVDMKKLCITSGEKVWIISIDVVTVNDAGNLLDASGLAALAAIKDARFPAFDGTKINYKELTKEKLPLTKLPIPVTVVKIGNHFLVDLLNDEEEFVEARLTVTTIENGEICALQKGGHAPITIDDVKEMIKIAQIKAKEIRKTL